MNPLNLYKRLIIFKSINKRFINNLYKLFKLIFDNNFSHN